MAAINPLTQQAIQMLSQPAPDTGQTAQQKQQAMAILGQLYNSAAASQNTAQAQAIQQMMQSVQQGTPMPGKGGTPTTPAQQGVNLGAPLSGPQG